MILALRTDALLYYHDSDVGVIGPTCRFVNGEMVLGRRRAVMLTPSLAQHNNTVTL